MDNEIITQKKENIIDWELFVKLNDNLTLWEIRIYDIIKDANARDYFDDNIKTWTAYFFSQGLMESQILSDDLDIAIITNVKIRLIKKRVMELKKLYKRFKEKNTN